MAKKKSTKYEEPSRPADATQSGPADKDGHRYDPAIEQQVVAQLLNREYYPAKTAKSDEDADFQSYLDLFDNVRTEKDYDWMSDISIPEFATHELTQAAMAADQYFQTRDFVEVYLQDEGEPAKLASEAAKECLNRTLNQRHLYHYPKFMRQRLINNLKGSVVLHCWWEQERRPVVLGFETKRIDLDVDVHGNPITDATQQTPATTEAVFPVMGEEAVIDRFNYDVLDPRNVFTSPEYAYSLQQKKWVIVRSEKTYQELLERKAANGYINLECLKRTRPSVNTETSRETTELDRRSVQTQQASALDVNRPYDILERSGRMWCKVTKRAEVTGTPIEVEPGVDLHGQPVEGAEFLEGISTVAMSEGNGTLIRFQVTPYISATGEPYRTLIRGLCYVHPVKDGGAGDGQYSRDLAVAANDTLNMSNDRTMLATMPTLKGKRYSTEDNPTIFFAPGHKMDLEHPDDVQEFKISDNIQGAMEQLSIMLGKMQQVNAVFPPQMGATPSVASTTATAIGSADQHGTVRSNFKSLTFENTCLSEFYWMILQMTWTFALPETGVKLMGQKVLSFNPKLEYTYRPLSQSIESEQSKARKIQHWKDVLGYVIQVQHPDAVKVFNYVLGQIASFMGDEFVNFKQALLDAATPMQTQGGPGQASPGAGGTPMSNQSSVPQSLGEQSARLAASG